jgi:hypothetical protein
MRRAEPLAGLGGLLLLISLFLPWAGEAIVTRGSAGSEGVTWISDANGWQTLAVVDVLLALLALLALAVPATSLFSKGPAKPIAAAVLASSFGWIAIVLVGIELVSSPVAGVGLRYGAWLALAGAVLAWVGSWLSLGDESTPGAVAPDIPRRPVPG